MRSVAVVGNSGSGKSTISRALAAFLGVPHVELDALFHQPNWQPLPAKEFLAAVGSRTSSAGWVVDGNYSTVADLVWERADTVVWLDLPRHVVMRQLIGRTVRRTARREELWNGNRERLRSALRLDPRESILRWAWTRHADYAERYAGRTTSARWAHLVVIRLRSRAEVAAFLQSLST